MSEVISFRLNKDNPREARALLILKKWRKGGHNIRYILTEALLRLDDNDEHKTTDEILTQLNEKLSILIEYIIQLERDKSQKLNVTKSVLLNTELHEGFIEGVRAAAKEGIRLS